MSRRTLLICFLPLVCLGLLISGCDKRYSSEPIEGRVVDAETGEPLQGVVVAANWELEIGTLGGAYPIGQLMVLESVTDENGRFAFPAWGPLEVEHGQLGMASPRLVLFRPDYDFRVLHNRFDPDDESEMRRSDWSGREIKLKRFAGSPSEYADRLLSIEIALRYMTRECLWKSVPNMVDALDLMSKYFEALEIVRGPYSKKYLARACHAR